VIVLGVVGLVFGQGGGEKIMDAVQGMVGENGGSAIRSMVQSTASKPQAGLVATIIGLLTLFLGASGVFVQLQESLNVIWKVAKKPSLGWKATLKQRLLSFGMVGAIAFLLLVSLVVSAGLSAMSGYLGEGLLWQALNAAVSIAVTAFLFGAIFKVLPDVRLRWRDVLIGGLFTAILFTLGKAAIGAYIGKSSVASSYGAAGSLIVVLLWVYYSSQLVLFGAEFTRAYATRGGRKVEPKKDATITVTPFTAAALGEKAKQGKLTSEPAGDHLPETAVPAGAGAAAAGAVLLAMASREHGRKARAEYAGGGLLLGAGAAMLAVRALLSHDGNGDGAKKEKDEGPSTASKVIAKIPTKVKVKTVTGALKGGGGEAVRELKDKITRRH
jgi:membrane protein